MNQKQQQDFQKNMRLQQIAQEKKGMAGVIIQAKMDSELFPVEKISQRWRKSVQTAVLTSSPISYQAKITDFAQAVRIVGRICDCNWEGPLTIAQFQTLANALDAVSPNTLGLPSEEYVELIDESVELVKIWTEKISAINTEAIIEAEQQYQVKHGAAGSKDKPTNGMSIVTGEA